MMSASDSNVGSSEQESSIAEKKSNNNKDEVLCKEGLLNNNKEEGVIIQTESTNTENAKEVHESNTVSNYGVNLTTSVPAAPQDQSEQLEATNEEDVVEKYDHKQCNLM